MNRNHSSNRFNRNYGDNRFRRQTADVKLNWWLATGWPVHVSTGRVFRRGSTQYLLPARCFSRTGCSAHASLAAPTAQCLGTLGLLWHCKTTRTENTDPRGDAWTQLPHLVTRKVIPINAYIFPQHAGGPPDPGESPGSFSPCLVPISAFRFPPPLRAPSSSKPRGIRVLAGDSLGLRPLLPILSPLPLTEWGRGEQEKRSLHWLATHTACQTKTKPQIQALTWSKGSSLTFEHIYKKRQNKASELLQTEVRVSKYLRNTICSILFSNNVLHLLNSNWSKNLSAIIPHYTSISADTYVHRYYFPLTAIQKDENLYALTL